jgi:hypothetical protein
VLFEHGERMEAGIETSAGSLAEDPAVQRETAGSPPKSGDPAEVRVDRSSDRLEGYTDNYLRVSLPYDPDLVNTIVPVALEKINGDGHMIGGIRPIDKRSVDPMGRPACRQAGAIRYPVAN